MQKLLHMTGCLEFADPATKPDNCFTTALQSCEEHGLEHEVLSADEVNARFPGYQLPPNFRVRPSIVFAPSVFSTNINMVSQHLGPSDNGLACMQALYQPQGGILASEKCIAAHVEAALQSGAELHTEERVLGWQVLSSGMVEVTTAQGAYQAVKLVLTAGAWMPQIVPQLQVLCSFPCSQPNSMSVQSEQVLHAWHDMPTADINPCGWPFGCLQR